MTTLLLCGACLPALALFAGAAQAQAVQTGPDAAVTGAAEAGGEIVVTGSRIRRDPLDNDSPVVVLDQSSLRQTGLTSVADILQRLPSAAGGLNTKTNNSGNIGNPQDGGGVGAGSAEIDLRYLLAKRTLVLVDGLRFINGASASGIPSTVDLNTIPNSMVERIEVLQSGQSPLYGSDAIAGVVNIITKQSQKGLLASAQYGKYRAGDGGAQDYNISYGLQSPSTGTSIVVGASYVKQNAVRTANRDISQFPNAGQVSCAEPIGGCSSATPLGRYDINGRRLTLKQPVIGRRPVYNAADPVGPNSDYTTYTGAAAYNFAPFNYFLTPSERYGGYVSARQELGSDVNLRVKALYNRRNSQNQAAFLPLSIGPDAGNGTLLDRIVIDASNPFNPFGTTLSPGGDGNAPANYSMIRRRLVEAGQRTYTQHVDTWSLTGTLDGKFEVGNRTFYWDVNAVIGFNNAEQVFTGNVNSARLARALGPVSQCTDGCVPFNIFGGAGSITQAMLDYVGFVEHDSSSQSLQDYTANLTGDLFDLPAGPVGFAVGYEHREQFGQFDPDTIIQQGLGADIPAQAASGYFNTDEFYGEIRVPILKDTPFFQSLELDGAARHANYSTSGSSTTLTGSALWKPINDLLLRGSYAEGFRAPSIGELFGAQSRADAPIDDPCTNVPGSQYQGSATVRSNCTANGVPANGSYSEPLGGQIGTLTGGNRNLAPETSKTWLFGAVYSPNWVRDAGVASQFSIEANYYDIKVKGAIAAINPQVTLSRCATLGDALSCGNVIRTPSGQIASVIGLLQNIGGIRTRGVDLTINYRSPETGIGTFGFNLNGNHLAKYEESFPTEDGTSTLNYRGTTRGFPDQSYPKFKGTGVVSWAAGPVEASFTGRYINHVSEADGRKLNNRFYGDVQLTLSPDFLDNKMSFTLGVLNLFNQDPPACFSCTGPNYDPTTYDVPGQFGYFRITYRM
ncbi:TonB-dependent receptor [uncultured Sphingomonas sp.]|uniref:TonB-dependent receptor domain-containing protein n=1 Tax=uncultured Sphingomonas sp. TaxID=158754 RepID=UPI0025FA4666|nr:TonB-dependent receptor [uncultured Sphingomonas sp.]